MEARREVLEEALTALSMIGGRRLVRIRLSDGKRLSVLNDWKEGDDPATAAFLREVRDGACETFGTVLSPDYNAAHRDHFHLDQAARGFGGVCR